jgi:hypothetical protein
MKDYWLAQEKSMLRWAWFSFYGMLFCLLLAAWCLWDFATKHAVLDLLLTGWNIFFAYRMSYHVTNFKKLAATAGANAKF